MQGFHPGEEKTKPKTQTKQASIKTTTTKKKLNQTKQSQKPSMDRIFNKQFFLQD